MKEVKAIIRDNVSACIRVNQLVKLQESVKADIIKNPKEQ